MYKQASLTPQEQAVLLDQATEPPYVGKYVNGGDNGTYLCRLCGLSLFRAIHKFHSGCGWPSFDKVVNNHVKEQLDADGKRTEILCSRCNGHLGHVFHGEGFTQLNSRHCVNSLSLDLVNSATISDSEEIIIAGGCFWGIEYYLQKLTGVVFTCVGYCGGNTSNPTYQEVCTQRTHHLECVRVIYDPSITSLETIIKCFLEIHDPSQADGQGPDIGNQYLSAIFCYNEPQKELATALITQLERQGNSIATQIKDIAIFWPGEDYHQNYYNQKHSLPYCHHYVKRF